MAFRFLTPPPENAVVYKKLKYITEDKPNAAGTHKFYLKFWIGKSQKPTSYYFNSEEERTKYIQNHLIAFEDKKEVAKTEHKNKDKELKEQFKQQLKVGTILHYCWGYDQTNCEFYQIIEIKNSTVKMRRIAAKSAGAASYMAEYVQPCPNEFIRDEIVTKRIGAGAIVIDYGIATIAEPHKKYYSSWYA